MKKRLDHSSRFFLVEMRSYIDVLSHNPIKTYKSFVFKALESFACIRSLRKPT